MKCNGCEERPRYPHWVTVERPKPDATKGADGLVDLADDDNWEKVGRIKVRFITKGGREGRVFNQVQAEVSHVIGTPSTQRSRNQIDPTCRLLMGTRTFNITTAFDIDEERNEVRIETTEVK